MNFVSSLARTTYHFVIAKSLRNKFWRIPLVFWKECSDCFQTDRARCVETSNFHFETNDRKLREISKNREMFREERVSLEFSVRLSTSVWKSEDSFLPRYLGSRRGTQFRARMITKQKKEKGREKDAVRGVNLCNEWLLIGISNIVGLIVRNRRGEAELRPKRETKKQGNVAE